MDDLFNRLRLVDPTVQRFWAVPMSADPMEMMLSEMLESVEDSHPWPQLTPATGPFPSLISNEVNGVKYYLFTVDDKMCPLSQFYPAKVAEAGNLFPTVSHFGMEVCGSE